MALDTYTLSVLSLDASGDVLPDARVVATLSDADMTAAGVVLPTRIEAQADGDGLAELELASNLDGTQNSRYRIEIYRQTGKLARIYDGIQMPRANTTLQQIIDSPEQVVSLSGAAISAALAQEWAEGTEPGGEGTKSSREWAEESEAFRDAAEGFAGDASTSAGQAADSATAAGDAQTDAETARDKAQEWAESEGQEPGGAGTKSAKEWAGEAEGEADRAEAAADSIDAEGVSATPAPDTIPKSAPDSNFVNEGWLNPNQFPLANQQDRERFFRNVLQPAGIDIPPDVLFWPSPYRSGGYEADVARPGTGWVFNNFGVLVPNSTDVLRRDFDPATGAFLGALAEPQRENLSPNWSLDGVALGDLENGGTLPDGWAYIAEDVPLGVTVEVVGVGVDDGVPYFDLRAYGTVPDIPATDRRLRIFTPIATIQNGVNHGASFFWKAVQGNAGQIGLEDFRAGASLGVGQISFGSFDAARFSEARVGGIIGPSTGTTGRLDIRSRWEVGELDVTYRIGGVQIEEGEFVSSPIVTNGSATIRPADTLTLPQVGDRRRGFICWEGVMDFDPGVGSGTADRANKFPFGRSEAFQSAQLRSAAGVWWAASIFDVGNPSVSISPVAGGDLNSRLVRIAAWWDVAQGLFGLSVDGGSAVNDDGSASTPPPDDPIRVGQTDANREARSFTNWIYISYNIPPIDRIEALTRFDGSLIVQGGTP